MYKYKVQGSATGTICTRTQYTV